MRCLRINEVENLTGLKKSKLYNLMREGLLPKPFKAGKASLWLEADVEKAMLKNFYHTPKSQIIDEGV